MRLKDDDNVAASIGDDPYVVPGGFLACQPKTASYERPVDHAVESRMKDEGLPVPVALRVRG